MFKKVEKVKSDLVIELMQCVSLCVSGVSRHTEWPELHRLPGEPIQPDQRPLWRLWDHYREPGDHPDREQLGFLLPQGAKTNKLSLDLCIWLYVHVFLTSSAFTLAPRLYAKWRATSSSPWITFRRSLCGSCESSEETASTIDASPCPSSSTTLRRVPVAYSNWGSQTWRVRERQ